MAKIVLTDAKITVNSVNLSSWIASVTLTTDVAEVATTAFGDSAVTRVGGLKDNSIQLEFHQDFAGSAVEATIYPLIGTLTTVVVQPISTAPSASNPSYTFSALISSWTPIAGAVGDLATASVTWQISGGITKAAP
jgi:hypothetical protein